MPDIVKEFNDYRTKMNAKILGDDNNKIIKRIFNLDTNAYAEGALDVGVVAAELGVHLADDEVALLHLARGRYPERVRIRIAVAGPEK